jgi:hypothetical protein
MVSIKRSKITREKKTSKVASRRKKEKETL